MSFADIRIVAFALILAVTYGTFLFFNANAGEVEYTTDQINATQYDTPDSSSFFSELNAITTLQDEHPEIFFVNTMLFGIIVFLLLFVGLRFLRGTG